MRKKWLRNPFVYWVNSALKTDFHLFLALFAGFTDTWRSAIGLTFYFFLFFYQIKKKSEKSCDNHGRMPTSPTGVKVGLIELQSPCGNF